MHNKDSSERDKVSTRLRTGVINYEEGDIDVETLINAMPTSRISKEKLARYKSLNLPSATENDLAIAFGQKRFSLPSALETIENFRNAIGEKVHAKTDKFRKCFKPLKIISEITSKTLTGEIEEANDLRRSYTQEQCLGREDFQIINN